MQYRLPWEAESEFAMRGGIAADPSHPTRPTLPEDPFADDLGHYAIYRANSGGILEDGGAGVHPAGSRAANVLGINDAVGNVWQWQGDWWGSISSERAENPTGPGSGSLRVVRGGSWDFVAGFCRPRYRYFVRPVFRSLDVGLRLVRIPAP